MRFAILTALLLIGCETSTETEIDQDPWCMRRQHVTSDVTEGETIDTYFATRSRLGLLIQEDRDTGSDGVLDSVGRWNYNELALATRWTVDSDRDGDTDAFYEIQYDENGSRLRYLYSVYGRNNEIREYRNHSNGLVDVVNIDDNGDGVFDEEWTYSYPSEEREEISVRHLRSDQISGTISKWREDDTHTIVEERRVPSDELVYRRTYEYTTFGRLAAFAGDEDGDGTIDQTYEATYDANRQIIQDVTVRQDTTRIVTQYEYDCER